MPASRTASRDFLRLALFACSTPLLAALSKAAVTARNAVDASSFFPAVTSERYVFSSVLRREWALWLRRCLRALLRMRRSADSVFGIISTFLQILGRNRSGMTGFVICLFAV